MKTNTARAKLLSQWLSKHDARILWQLTSPHAFTLTCYCLGWPSRSMPLIVQTFEDGNWNIFTSATTNDSALTLEDAEKRIGVCPTVTLSRGIEFQMKTPNGPRVEYGPDDDGHAVLRAAPRGYGVDFSNQIKLANGRYRAPLVKL